MPFLHPSKNNSICLVQNKFNAFTYINVKILDKTIQTISFHKNNKFKEKKSLIEINLMQLYNY